MIRPASRTADTGSTMVEFAIVLPVFLIILFGILQWGFIFSSRLILRNAVAVGARSVVLYQGNASAGEAATLSAISPLDPANASVTCLKGLTAGSDSTCDLTYDYALFFPAVVPGSVNGILTIGASAVMR